MQNKNTQLKSKKPYRPWAMGYGLITLLAMGHGLWACTNYGPLYTSAANTVALGEIHMTNPDKNIGERRVAQIVRKNLMQSFPPHGQQDYVLFVEIEETKDTLAVAQDATAERFQLSLTGNVILKKAEDTVFQTELYANSAYNVENTPFSTESGKVFAREAAASSLADSIAQEVRLFLRQTN